ncbi:unnamed protein product [Arctogadus glacialis]
MVIDGYMHILIGDHQMPIHQLSAVVATSLFGGQFKHLKKMKFPVEEMWMCPVNVGAHWILVIVNMSDKVLVVMDPKGNEGHHACKLLRNWRNFLRITDFGDKGATWTVQTMQHNKQQDSSSCGILVLRQFADDYLRYGDISDVQTSPRAVHQARLHVATALLQCKKGMQRTSVWCAPLPKKMQMRA